MLNQHKQRRMKRRSLWKRLKALEKENILYTKPTNYLKLKKYENRKRTNSLIKKTNENENEKNKITIRKDIDFEDNIENIVKFTKDVDDLIATSSKKKFSINHKNIENISIGGLLYLVGQISKITSAKYNDSDYHLKYNKKIGLQNNNRIKYLFNEIGYWKYFGIKKPYKTDKCVKDNYFLSIETSNKSDINLLNKIKTFINNNVEFLQDDYGLEYQFDDTIKEAMGNSIEHAYDADFSELGKEKGKWWICGHYDKQRQSLELVFYDYGIGIRKSMNYNLGEEVDKVFLDKLRDNTTRKDADLIEIAINGDLAKYKKYKDHDRGKGFKRFQQFAKASNNNCDLTIVSNAGKYKFSYNAKTKQEIVTKTNLSASIDGVLIKWKIDLSEKENK